MTQFRPSSFQILPPIVKNLLIINGLVFFAQYIFKTSDFSFSIDDNFALHAWQSSLFKPWQLLTHMFLHGDPWHIIGNMFALWMFGSVLENLWGSKRFLIFYMVCGLGAALIHLLFLSYELVPLMKEYANIFQLHMNGSQEQGNAMYAFINKNHMSFGPYGEELQSYIRSGASIDQQNAFIFKIITALYENNLNTATIGASGAIFGVLAAFVYLFPNTYIYIYFLVPVKAKWLGILYFLFELFNAIRNSAGDNVSRWAHVGGAIVGLLIVITWNKTNKKTFY